MMDVPEPIRRLSASVFQWGGWMGALGVFVFASVSYDPAHGKFAPQWVGLTFIGLMGLAIAGSVARSRMRLSDTIVDALRAGMLSERAREKREREARDAEGTLIRRYNEKEGRPVNHTERPL